MPEENRLDRQIAWFGKKGQRKISSCKVGIVGCGGLGSHVAQQLAYLGVKNITLIDSDKIKDTNLNRLIGANSKDVGKTKVEVVRRLVKFIDNDIKVRTVYNSFIDEDGISALKKVDFIFGCTDKDGARLLLTEFSKAYKKPYFDIATEINEDYWGGRTFLADEDYGCLVCANQLTQDEIHRDLSTPENRSVDDKIYGVDRKLLGTSGPSVVSLNGILASLAVTEFLAFITGIRKVKKFLEYKGQIGIVATVQDPFIQDCYYCTEVLGIRNKVMMERYIKQGINKILR